MRIYTDKRIHDLWPAVTMIKIHTEQTYRSAFGLFTHESTGTYFPDFAANFHVDCINKDCTVGYFDLWPVVSSMCAHSETCLEGALECRGNEARDHRHPCPCRLEYQIEIEYSTIVQQEADDGAKPGMGTTENSV